MSVPNQPDPFFHNRPNVQSVRVSSIGGDDTNPSHLLNRQERLVQRLADIGLQRQRLADLVDDRLGFVEGGSVNRDVQPVGGELFHSLSHVFVDNEVDGTDPHLFRLGKTVGNFVNPDDTGCALDESPFCGTESDGSQSLQKSHRYSSSDQKKTQSHPDTDNVAFFHAGIRDSMIRRRQHVRQIQRLLIRNFIRHGQTVDLSKRHPNVLGLPTGKTSSKVRITKEPGIASTVHVLLERRGVRSVAHRAELLLTVGAFSASDLEGYDDALAGMKRFDGWPDPVNYTHEFVAKDITLFEGEDLTVVQVEIRACVRVRKPFNMSEINLSHRR